jgi:hypothetical protein
MDAIKGKLALLAILKRSSVNQPLPFLVLAGLGWSKIPMVLWIL